jgi:hypothetical protein
MLTRLHIRNFKRFGEADIELGKSVVFIGPNNAGKTSALQALALWDVGLRQWNAKRGGRASPEKRPGVIINRRDLVSTPVPAANMIWRDLHVRSVRQEDGKPKTRNIRVDVRVDGVASRGRWTCGLEFDYQNEESFACRPLREKGSGDLRVGQAKFSTIPEEAANVRVAYLPPMSGLAALEPKLEPGRVSVLVGEGQTAQVLRNLCHQVYENGSDPEHINWSKLQDHIRSLFDVKLLPPLFVQERGEIRMEYEEHGTRLDLSCSGRGLQQTLLLLAHMYANPSTVLLLDEPDAHLEILRQRQTYGLLCSVADAMGSQVIAASHSEVVLNEAAGRDIVVAFVGKPHRINDRGSQVLKALNSIGFEQYYQAEQTGWVLYVEDSTDLAILRAFAELLGHEAAEHLGKPFVHYVTNLPRLARDHFYGLREAKSDLRGIAIFDRVDNELRDRDNLIELMWRRREIENYLCATDVLMAYAEGTQTPGPLFEEGYRQRRAQAMRSSIDEVTRALSDLNKPDPSSPDIKATDDFLDPVFRKYFEKLKLPILFRKANYHELVTLIPKRSIDSEIVEKLDAISDVARSAHPTT